MGTKTDAILIIKTAALGDVLRTTAILPGLARQHPGARVAWVTAQGAIDLVRTHPLVSEVVAIDTRSKASVELVRERLLPTRWTRVISLDDEEPLCALASALKTDILSGAFMQPDGRRAYTSDVAPWFDMGLLSVHGKTEADRLKIVNQKSQPTIYAQMLGIEMGQPELHLPRAALEFGGAFAARTQLANNGPVIGLNTGAGGRWVSKQLSVERTVDLAGSLARELGGRASFVVFGGESESARNRAILCGMALDPRKPRAIDAGTENPLFEFAALVARCDLLITSDSLALHMAIAQGVQIVSFFAPTSAAEIELYGLGEKVVSTASDYCSYKPDADNSSISVERLLEASLRQLDAAAPRRGKRRGGPARG